ncbi:MAG: hypothetical protein ACI4AD_10085 [Roseburia sp.]
MKIDDLMDAIGKINLCYVKEAEDRSDYEESAEGNGNVRKTVRWRHRSLWLSAVACLCILVLGGTYGLWLQKGGSDTASSGAVMESAADDRMDGGMSDVTGAGAENGKESVADDEMDGGMSDVTGAVEEAAEENAAGAVEDIRINEITEVSGMDICMAEPASIKEMTLEEAEDYYGLRLLPEVLPEGVSLSEDGALHIAYAEDGSVMDDNNRLIFRDAEGEMRLQIQARTTESDSITEFVEDDLETSTIAGTSLTIGHGSWQEEQSYYLAIYREGAVTVTVQGYGIGQEDLLAVLRSLLAE